MKFRSFLFGSAVVGMLGVALVGCNDNPVVTGNSPTAPTNVVAVSKSATSVGLKWNKSSLATSYFVSWKGNTGLDTASITIQDTSTTITGLAANQSYTFTVKASNLDGSSVGSSVTWAPATRFTSDAGGVATIRMYEKLSTGGSGLILDPALTGPKNISVIPIATAGSVQLAMFAKADSFLIGPAFAFDEYKNGNNFYSTIAIGKTTFVAPSLDTWFSNTPIDQELLTTNANTSVYTLANTVTGSSGQGFYVRTGSSSADYHYARIFVKNNGGKLLQGSGTERYVELEISYQTGVNLPYAKVAPSMLSPRGVAARKMTF